METPRFQGFIQLIQPFRPTNLIINYLFTVFHQGS
jgi:hypothetical protein